MSGISDEGEVDDVVEKVRLKTHWYSLTWTNDEDREWFCTWSFPTVADARECAIESAPQWATRFKIQRIRGRHTVEGTL